MWNPELYPILTCLSLLRAKPRAAEGLDQTRGWFYTLMVLSTALFDKPAFKHLVCNGLVLAADGKKMSKRLKNYPVGSPQPRCLGSVPLYPAEGIHHMTG